MAELTHFDGRGNAIMVDVSEKQDTKRIATAVGRIRVNEAILKAVAEGTAKKGDVLGTARIAGIAAVKRTAELIPLCHVLAIHKCSVEFETNRERGEILARCTVKTEGKTGVEMEALTGVSTALLTIYDMCKAMDKGMVLDDIHLETKSGGKSGDFRFEARERGNTPGEQKNTLKEQRIRVAVITSSDLGYAGGREDLSGPAIREIVEAAGDRVVSMRILPDERDMLAAAMAEIADRGEADLILTTGGTGFSGRDITPEATLDVGERQVPGIPEAMRSYSM